MPRKLDITPRALNHLDNIQISLDEARSGRADKFIEQLRKVGDFLLVFPDMGFLREDIGQGVRTIFVWDYILFYRITDSHVKVEAVIHGARNIDAAFFDD